MSTVVHTIHHTNIYTSTAPSNTEIDVKTIIRIFNIADLEDAIHCV